jgi:osmoprotectant transport system permease protein
LEPRSVSLIGDVARWFADPAHWQGTHGVPARILEHLELSALAVAIAVLIAGPIALYLGHHGRGGFIAINVANIGRALPSFALLGFGLLIAISLGLGLGFWPTMFMLVPLAIPPIVTNTFVAVREVDRDVVDAARGMGLAEWQILRSIEIPLGLPLILAGIRTAAVNVVATATLGAVVAGGALGRFIVDGFAVRDYDQLVAGALLVALLAVVTEVSFGALERATVPPGMAAIR